MKQNSLPLIAAEALTVESEGRILLKNIHIEVYRGEIVTLVGPNGAGKTTLLKALLGLISLQEGRVVKHPTTTIGYVPQRLQLETLLPLTVQRFLELTPKLQTKQQGKKILAKTSDELALGGLLSQSLDQLSGGELQRVLLARALLREPNLLILDEPMQGIDLGGQNELYELLLGIRNQRQCGILMVSHDLHLVMKATDSVICLNGHICCSGHPQEIREHPEFLKLFGLKASDHLAIYTHHHSHHHGLHGAVVEHEHLKASDPC